jgi:hypothetical protein
VGTITAAWVLPALTQHAMPNNAENTVVWFMTILANRSERVVGKYSAVPAG